MMGGQMNSNMKWAFVECIVVGTVIIIAIIVIAHAILQCLKKVGSLMPAYTQIPTTDHRDNNNKSSISHHSENNKEMALEIPPPNSQTKFSTIERFLNGINKEKPIRFSPEELEEITKNYITILGLGAYGVVYKGELSNEEKVAVKVLNSLDLGTEEQFKAEVSTIGRTYHMNLVRLYGFCFTHNKRALVYEYVPNGSLNNLLFGNPNKKVEFRKLLEIAIGTAKGIAYLHEECQHRIIHYDIKPENILLGLNLEPKVADFGRRRDRSHVKMTHFRGTRGYAAPELWNLCHVNHKCDVYSFGIVLFEIVGRRRHFDSDCCESQQWLPKWTWDMFEKNELPVMLSLLGIEEEKDKEIAQRMLMVALWCVQYLPYDRPLMSNVVKMLEGDIEISPPPFPFQNLSSSKPKLTLKGTNEDLDASSSSSWVI